MLKGFEYAKYEDMDSGLSVLSLNKEAAGNRVKSVLLIVHGIKIRIIGFWAMIEPILP